MGRRGHRRGFEPERGAVFIEIMFGLVLIVLVGWIALRVTQTTSSAVKSVVSESQLDLQVHRVTERLSRELMQAGADTISPSPIQPLGAATLDYQRVDAITGGSPVWSSMRRIEFVAHATDPEDGTDNNGNGLVDEHEVHLVVDAGLPTENRVVVTRNAAAFLEGESENVLDDNDNGLIDERGLCFELRDGVLMIRLSLQAVAPGGSLVTRTAETGIRLRN